MLSLLLNILIIAIGLIGIFTNQMFSNLSSWIYNITEDGSMGHEIHPMAKCTANRSAINYSAHMFTMRPLDDYIYYQPVFFSFFSALNAVSEGDVLEVGCGSGRALVELKSRYPKMNIIGSNLRGYGFAQINGSLEELWAIADHFHLVVYCSRDKPIFPQIIETDKIQSQLFLASIANRRFDFIFSRHALNQGKLLSNESAISIPRLLPLLKRGGIAMLHLLFISFDKTSDITYFPLLAVYNLLFPDPASSAQQRVSVILYPTLCYEKHHCINLILKRCSPAAVLHPKFKDCIIPHILQYSCPSRDWVVKELLRVAALPPDPELADMSVYQRRSQAYAAEYMRELMRALEAWEKGEAIAFSPLFALS